MRVTTFLLVLLYGRDRSAGERLDTHTHTHEESPINLKSLFVTVKGKCSPGLAPWLQARRAGHDRFQLPGSISTVKLIFAAMIKQSLCYSLISTETRRARSPRKNGAVLSAHGPSRRKNTSNKKQFHGVGMKQFSWAGWPAWDEM